MAWKGLHLTQAARLSLADGQACVKTDAGEVRMPVEDMAFLIIDTPQATFSSALVSALCEAGVAVVFSDARHAPAGLLLPFHRHHRQGAVARLQAGMRESLKKKIWREIIRTKIVNQAAALAAVGHADAGALKEIARHVEPGDPENIESRAARFYWGRLFADFTREDESDRRNKMLNYGYAVIRAGVARALVASGFMPALGLKHDGAANAFNLADDLVEPFRPFVDLLASRTFGDGDRAGDLSIDDRRAMAGALHLNCATSNGVVPLLVGAEMAAASLLRCIEGDTPALLDLPAFMDAP
jgi:CRISPR-associated protein Cas1